MKLFVRPVLVGTARHNELHLDAQFDPPGAQTRQPQRSSRAKGRAIAVGAAG